MPVYLFTYHAYQSWLPDHQRGFVQKDRGVQPSNKRLADAYRRAAKAEAFEFEPATQYQLIAKARAVCEGDGYRLHGAATEPSHLHVLVSWQDEGILFTKIRGRIQNLLSLDLSKRAGITGRPWFSIGASRRRVRDNRHFRHLLDEYLPRHGGVINDACPVSPTLFVAFSWRLAESPCRHFRSQCLLNQARRPSIAVAIGTSRKPGGLRRGLCPAY